MTVIVAALGLVLAGCRRRPAHRGGQRQPRATAGQAGRTSPHWSTRCGWRSGGMPRWSRPRSAPAEADAMLRDALAAGAAEALRVEPASRTAGPRPAGLVGGGQDAAAALAAALRPALWSAGPGAVRRPLGRPGHWLLSRVPRRGARRVAGPGRRADGTWGRRRAAGAPPPGRRPPRGTAGAAARRGVGRGGRGTPPAGRAARHAGQRARRHSGGAARRWPPPRSGSGSWAPTRTGLGRASSRVRPVRRCAGRWS